MGIVVFGEEVFLVLLGDFLIAPIEEGLVTFLNGWGNVLLRTDALNTNSVLRIILNPCIEV